MFRDFNILRVLASNGVLAGTLRIGRVAVTAETLLELGKVNQSDLPVGVGCDELLLLDPTRPVKTENRRRTSAISACVIVAGRAYQERCSVQSYRLAKEVVGCTVGGGNHLLEYRHLDQTTRNLLDDLGRNETGQPARALLFDMISDGPFPLVQRVTHDRRFANVAYTQGHVLRLSNQKNALYFAPSDFAGFPMSFARRFDQVLVNADYGERGNPGSAPTLGPAPP